MDQATKIRHELDNALQALYAESEDQKVLQAEVDRLLKAIDALRRFEARQEGGIG